MKLYQKENFTWIKVETNEDLEQIIRRLEKDSMNDFQKIISNQWDAMETMQHKDDFKTSVPLLSSMKIEDSFIGNYAEAKVELIYILRDAFDENGFINVNNRYGQNSSESFLENLVQDGWDCIEINNLHDLDYKDVNNLDIVSKTLVLENDLNIDETLQAYLDENKINYTLISNMKHGVKCGLLDKLDKLKGKYTIYFHNTVAHEGLFGLIQRYKDIIGEIKCFVSDEETRKFLTNTCYGLGIKIEFLEVE